MGLLPVGRSCSWALQDSAALGLELSGCLLTSL
jgi:hypothetical protein